MTSVRLVPPDEPSKGVGAQEEAAWMALVSTQLADTRKSAEGWRNGLAGLLGLVSIFSVVRGRSEVSGLEDWAAGTTGVLLLLSVVAAVVGTVASSRAAYGHPTVLSRAAFRELGGVEGLRFEEARRAAADLRRARIATLLALVLAAAAVGLTWYGPRSAVDTVEVATRSGERVCGQLVQSGNGKVQIDSTTAGVVLVRLGEVSSMRVVESCR